jgi:hypothetical protein
MVTTRWHEEEGSLDYSATVAGIRLVSFWYIIEGQGRWAFVNGSMCEPQFAPLKAEAQ